MIRTGRSFRRVLDPDTQKQAQGHGVRWAPQARWVGDRNRWTSSGIAAGTDMALALIARLTEEGPNRTLREPEAELRCPGAS